MSSSSTTPDIASLKAENDALKQQIASLQVANIGAAHGKGVGLIPDTHGKCQNEQSTGDSSLSIIIIGASGDLAFKKTFPALFSLYVHNLLPKDTIIAGYARSKMEDSEFKQKISQKFPSKYQSESKEFLNNSFYFAGQYDSKDDFTKFEKELSQREQKTGKGKHANRIFYMAIPPTLFVEVGKGIQPAAMSKTGWNRVIVEKPFGKDSESYAELKNHLSALFQEDQIYRIDHYLGKEMVQNLIVLRFANTVFEPIWNRDHIASVQITFKEDFGTQGRGGYFDNFGIIRDVMQNHLLQIFSLIGMEPPVTLSAEDVRDEKVKFLRAVRAITLDDLVIGQYSADPKGTEPGYLEDKTVPKDSITPTYSLAVLHVDNTRWAGIPFILKCGKALNQKKTEIRVQFKLPVNNLFSDLSPNELVMRVSPDEAVYLKMSTKQPGLEGGIRHTELNLSYKDRFKEEAKDLPDAYERLINDVYRGDHNLFVRNDELEAAWNIFTPILHRLEKEKIKPITYQFGSRGPKEADALIEKYGYVRTDKYEWSADGSNKKPPNEHGEGIKRAASPAAKL